MRTERPTVVLRNSSIVSSLLLFACSAAPARHGRQRGPPSQRSVPVGCWLACPSFTQKHAHGATATAHTRETGHRNPRTRFLSPRCPTVPFCYGAPQAARGPLSCPLRPDSPRLAAPLSLMLSLRTSRRSVASLLLLFVSALVLLLSILPPLPVVGYPCGWTAPAGSTSGTGCLASSWQWCNTWCSAPYSGRAKYGGGPCPSGGTCTTCLNNVLRKGPLSCMSPVLASHAEWPFRVAEQRQAHMRCMLRCFHFAVCLCVLHRVLLSFVHIDETPLIESCFACPLCTERQGTRLPKAACAGGGDEGRVFLTVP
jgi:hypothetical protein